MGDTPELPILKKPAGSAVSIEELEKYAKLRSDDSRLIELRNEWIMASKFLAGASDAEIKKHINEERQRQKSSPRFDKNGKDLLEEKRLKELGIPLDEPIMPELKAIARSVFAKMFSEDKTSNDKELDNLRKEWISASKFYKGADGQPLSDDALKRQINEDRRNRGVEIRFDEKGKDLLEEKRLKELGVTSQEPKIKKYFDNETLKDVNEASMEIDPKSFKKAVTAMTKEMLKNPEAISENLVVPHNQNKNRDLTV